MSDLKENLHTEHMVLNMGPSHPATHGTVKFLLTLDGETIVNCVIDVGYLHRGFERVLFLKTNRLIEMQSPVKHTV